MPSRPLRHSRPSPPGLPHAYSSLLPGVLSTKPAIVATTTTVIGRPRAALAVFVAMLVPLVVVVRLLLLLLPTAASPAAAASAPHEPSLADLALQKVLAD